MKRIIKSILIVTLVTALSALAVLSQDKDKEKDWRPVSPAELQSKAPVVESDADAEAIFWEVRIDDSKDDLSMTHYVRVKVYTERGRENYSKFDVPFNKDTKIKDLAARVVKADGSVVEINKADIFEREIVKAGGVKIKAKSFAVPNLEPGAIIEYRYREVVNDAGASGMRLPFQRDIPIQTLSYYYRPANKLAPNYRPYNLPDTQFVKDADGFWLAKRTDVPAFKEEPRMPPEDSIRAWMSLSGVSIFTFTTSSSSSFSIIFTESKEPRQYWASFGEGLAGLVKWMNKDNKDIKKTADEITAGASTADEKLRKIYDFCQNQINNTAYDTSMTDEQRKKLPKVESVNDVLKRRAGGGGYIDYLFGALAHAAGFETAIAYTGDKRKILFSPDMTNRDLLIHAATAVKVDKQWQYFDPGTKFLPYGMLRWFEEGSWAIIVGEGRFDAKETPLTDFSKTSAKRTAKLTVNDDGSLEGDVAIESDGQYALAYRLDNYDETREKQEQSLIDEVKARMNAAEVTNVVIENLTDISKPLVQKYHVRVPSYAQRTGKRLFVQPNYFKYGVGSEFSSSTRKYDIFFRYPWSENDTIDITWPAGFDLDNADAPADVADTRKIGEITVKIAADRAHNTLRYSRQFHFGGGGSVLFGAQMYTPLKNLFDAFHTVDAHTVTLKQKQ
jgi:hypothetical protein